MKHHRTHQQVPSLYAGSRADRACCRDLEELRATKMRLSPGLAPCHPEVTAVVADTKRNSSHHPKNTMRAAAPVSTCAPSLEASMTVVNIANPTWLPQDKVAEAKERLMRPVDTVGTTQWAGRASSGMLLSPLLPPTEQQIT